MTGFDRRGAPLTLDQMQAQAAGFPAQVQTTGGTTHTRRLVDLPRPATDALMSAIYQLAALRWDYVTGGQGGEVHT